MPKIIKDVEEKILDAAQHLFTVESYADVDMRRIARETSIATGTLYNYFSSKQDLLLAVFEHSWRVSAQRLEASLQEADDREPPVDRFIRLLSQEFRRNKNLAEAHLQVMMREHAKQMAENHGKPPTSIRLLQQNVAPLFQEAVCRQYECRVNSQLSGNLRRIIEVLPMLLVVTDEMNAGTPDENIRFVQELVNGYLTNQLR